MKGGVYPIIRYLKRPLVFIGQGSIQQNTLDLEDAWSLDDVYVTDLPSVRVVAFG